VTITADIGDDITCTFINEVGARLVARKHEDHNGNGRYSSGEAFLPGWTMTLYDDQGGTVNSKVTNSTGRAVFARLDAGDYTVCETLQSGWTNTEPGTMHPTYNQPCHAVSLQYGERRPVFFGNLQPATITIMKDTQPDSVRNFAFSGDLGGFRLDDASPDDGDGFANSATFVVGANTYTVTEADASAAGWFLTDIQCDPAGKAVLDLPNRRVTITADIGDDITCTFINSR